MSTGIPKTNFFFIENEFEEIIEIRNGCVGLESDPPGVIRKTIIFDDMTKLACQEFIKDGQIELYFYDYYDRDGNIIMKFHSEPHDDKTYQTETEPFHMHVRADASDLKASKRIANKYYKELYDILTFIVTHRYAKYAYLKEQRKYNYYY